jgi:hypothetical protein
MNNQLLFAFQIAMSLIVYGLVARVYLSPALARRSIVDALTPLLLFHATRYIGAVFLTPSVTDASIPASFTVPGAVGDVLSAFLALGALAALRSGSRWALALVWVFNVWGTFDFLNAFANGIALGLPNYPLGAVWFIPTLLVPAYFVLHVLIFGILLTRSGELRGSAKPINTVSSAV